MVSWNLINTFGIPVGLFLLRNGYSFYQKTRATYNARRPQIRDTPPKTARALNVLFAFAVVALLYTLPYFSPENVFDVTLTNPQTTTDIIFSRLAAKRLLTSFDQELKSKLTSKNARLIYCAYGPETLAHCNFCSPADPLTYLYYSLPSLAAPHLLHLLLLGFATSALVAGAQGARWRTQATLAALALAAADFYLHLTYDLNANHGKGAKEVDYFFWRMRLLRGVGVAVVDGLLGWVMYLSSTNRFFLASPFPAQRIEAASSALEALNFRLWATGNVRNAVVRDKELREDMTRYWLEEKEVFEDRNVVRAIQAALERTDMRALSQAAEQRSTDILNVLGP